MFYKVDCHKRPSLIDYPWFSKISIIWSIGQSFQKIFSFSETILCSWSSLVAGDEGSYLPNGQSNLVIALHALSLLSLLFGNFINTTAYLWAYTSLHLPLAVVLPALFNHSSYLFEPKKTHANAYKFSNPKAYTHIFF